MTSQIHDLGYRAYTGERQGVGWAVRSLVVHTIRRSLGLKRSARHKLAPMATIAIAYLPALFMTALAIFLGGEIANDLVGYGDYFGLSGLALFLFAAAVSPGVITTDRTNGMLALYLASPLTRTTYVLARALGIWIVMLIVCVGPILFLILGYTFAGAGPDGVLGFFEVIGQAVFIGALTAAAYTGLGMFVSSIPRRWAIASVSIVAFFLITSIVPAGLVDGSAVNRWILLAAPSQVLSEAAERVFDDPVFDFVGLDSLPGGPLIAMSVAYAIAGLVITWWRYQVLAVER
ncbi:MAG: ABC transporter permease [Actinomycetota bacterium]